MDTRFKKFALATFMGGIIGGITFYVLFPETWTRWLGVLTGFSGGYLAYVYKEIPEKSAIAFKKTVFITGMTFEKVMKGLRFCGLWIKMWQPVIVVGMIIFCLVILSTLYFSLFLTGNSLSEEFANNSAGIIVPYSLLIFVYFGLISLMTWAILDDVMDTEKIYVVGVGMSSDDEWYRKLREQGFKETAVTYRNAFKWLFLKGLFPAIRFATTRACEAAVVIVKPIQWITQAGFFTVIFLLELFILIHKKDALLAGVFGALGIVAGAAVLWPASLTVVQKIAGVVSSGIFSLVLGIAYDKTLAVPVRRAFHIVPNGA